MPELTPPALRRPLVTGRPGLALRLTAWLGVSLMGLALPFSEQMAQGVLAQELPQSQSLQPGAAHLHLRTPQQVSEGRRFELHLGWRDLPAGAQVEPVELTLRWQGRNYKGEPQTFSKSLALGPNVHSLPLHFESPGQHQVDILGPDQKVWKSLRFDASPFPARIFPSEQARQASLSQDPERFHIYVNLHFDPETPQQRQYAQIVHDGEIVERLLISSGAGVKATPQGEFLVGFKDFYPRSSLYNNTPMPFWSSINMNGNQGEYGFHALEDGGYLYLLGRPASHGCIRMSRLASVETDPQTGESYWGDRGGARWIYDRVPEKAPVSIFAQALPAFAFEDYTAYLARQAREYQQKQARL